METAEVPNPLCESYFGEVFITNSEVEGCLEPLKHFRGKLITQICGGYNKLFIIEQGNQENGIISCLHAPQYDDYDMNFTDVQDQPANIEEIFASFDGKGQIRTIACGKQFTVMLTEAGQLYSYGINEFGVLGTGGTQSCNIPRHILKLQDRQINQVTCGEYHTLALNLDGDVYSWGRGFEGQLGLGPIETAASPTYIKKFFQLLNHRSKNKFTQSDIENNTEFKHNDIVDIIYNMKTKIKKIYCGAYHSIAISNEDQLYIWGDNSLGAVGIGRKKGQPENKSNQSRSCQNVPILLNVTGEKEEKIIEISAGYGHTCVIDSNKNIYSWGFNIKGQLGNGDKTSQYTPVQITKDILKNDIVKFTKVVCGYNNTFAIGENGNLWSWGGGYLGTRHDYQCDYPRRLFENAENRIYSQIISTSNSTIFFAKMRVLSVKPNYGPSSGETMINLLGTGFTHTEKQKLKFIIDKNELEVPLTYDHHSDSFFCKTPKFDDLLENVSYPIQCRLQLTLDGKQYTECESQFLIYSSKLKLESVNPKQASVLGGTELYLNMNIDPLTESYLQLLTISFQLKQFKDEKKTEAKVAKVNGQVVVPEANTVNPLDFSLNDPELDKENYICIESEYSKGKIICKCPDISLLVDQNNPIFSLNYNIDVSLNGQQFTGKPLSFKFYDIKIQSITPNNTTTNGSAQCVIQGSGFFDSAAKKLAFISKQGKREVDLVWDKVTKSYSFTAPPLLWLVDNQEATETEILSLCDEPVQLEFTINGIEWIKAGGFNYMNLNVDYITSQVYDKQKTMEEVDKSFYDKEDLVNVLQGLEGEEYEKKKLEVDNLREDEIKETQEFFKKEGQHMYINGQNYIDSEPEIMLIVDQKIKKIKGVVKNTNKLGFIVPSLEEFELATGIYEVIVEISFNQQQYSNSKKFFKYLNFEKGMDTKAMSKYEDEQLKIIKKAQVPTKGKK